MRILVDNVTLLFIIAGLFFLPFSTSVQSQLSVMSFADPFFFMACILCLINAFTGRINIHTHLILPVLVMFLFLTAMLFFSFLSPNVVASLKRVLYNFIGFTLFIYILSFCSQNKTDAYLAIKYIVNIIIISGIILSLYFILHVCINSYQHGIKAVFSQRFVGGFMSLPWGASNEIAALLLIDIYISAMWYSLTKKNKYMIAIFIMLLALFLTFSRNAGLLALLSLLLIWLLAKQYRYIIYMFIILLAVTFILKHFDHTMLHDRLSKLSNLNGRAAIWKESLQYIQKTPFTVIGYFGSIYVFGHTSHNLLITTFLEQGIIGIIMILLVYAVSSYWLIKHMRSAMKPHKLLYMILFIGLIFNFINLQFEDAYFAEQYIIFFWLYMAIIYILPYYLKAITVSLNNELKG